MSNHSINATAKKCYDTVDWNSGEMFRTFLSSHLREEHWLGIWQHQYPTSVIKLDASNSVGHLSADVMDWHISHFEFI